MNSSPVLPNEGLFHKYNVRGSYYTAYPPSGLWVEGLSSNDYREALKEILLKRPEEPLQFYVHFPYCKVQCWFCQCFQMVTNDQGKIRKITESLTKEIDLLFDFFSEYSIPTNFVEIHLGGGSPSHMELEEFDLLVDKILSYIDIKKVSEFAIEIDPRTVTKEKIKHYRNKGINRISFGIQDFDLDVQKAINRVHSIEQIEELLETRSLFKGVNFDLIYGLPLQTRESLKKTLDEVIRLSPDRMAFSVLGYRPDVFKHNRVIKESDLPGLIEAKLMWEDSCKNFLDHGYERIGMDHFAKPEDELGIAKKNRTLFRNPMGYSPGRFQDTISLGPSGMTRLGNYYFQNAYSLSDYCATVDKRDFPTIRGYKLNQNALIRRDIMNRIMTYYRLDYSYIEQKYGIDFNEYFKDEIISLGDFVKEGLLEISWDKISVTPLGNFFLRNICMIFDNLEKEYKHNMETAPRRYAVI